MSSAASLLMAGDEMCYTDSDHAPGSMFEMARELEERIREYSIDADADSVEPDTTYEDSYVDVALHSGDFFMPSWLPDAVIAADAAVTAAMEPATIVPHCGVPMVRPVPRPRLSKMSASRLETSQIAQAHHHGGSSGGAGSSHCTGADVQEESKNCHTADAVGDGRLLSGYRALLGDRMHATAAATHYRAQLEFAQKLGFSEAELVAAHAAVGPDTDTNKLLSALIRVHDADGASKAGVAERGFDATLPPPLQASFAQPPSSATSCNHAETASSSSRRSSAEMLARSVSEEAVFATFAAAADDDGLRVIVVDGSNVAMGHGNKQVFSCRGIQIVVNWFRQRGHKRITVFVPQWRKETSYPMAPISDQHVLDELEQDKVLVYTPSRRLHGRRVVCYDDRYVLQLASSEDAVVVSNDNYRDLIKENPAYKRVVEERLLMYSFVADRFMPPDDPLGRHGPTLDQFLRRFPAGCIGSGPASARHSSQLCPYGRKCTYGSKCKYAHPERFASAAGSGSGGLGVAGRLDSHYSTAAAAGRAASSVAAWSPAAAVGDGCYATDSVAYSTRLAEPCSRNQVARSVSSSSAGDRRRCFGIATWSLGSSVDDEDRTHSLPIEAASAAAAAAAVSGDDQWQQYASSVRLRTDTDVLRECEQRLALVRGAAAAAPAAAAGTSGAAAAVQWRRRSQPLISSAAAATASALDGQSGLPSSVPAAAAAAHSDCAWPLQPERGYEDVCISDPGGFHFLPSATAAAGSYDVSSGCRHSCGGSLQSCLPLSSALQRQLSYSDSHLSVGSGSSDSMLLHSSAYGSGGGGGGDLVARTSWPYGRAAYGGVDDDEESAAAAGSRLYEAKLLAQQCTAGGGVGSGAASPGYRELLSGAQPWSPYYSEGYAPVLLQPQLPVSMQFPVAMLAHGPGPMSGCYGYAKGRSRSALGPSSAADPSPPPAGFLPRQAQQSRGGRTASSLSSLQPPIGDDGQSFRGGGSSVGSRK